MAVYTEISDEALSQFLESYDIGELLSYKGIAEGVENTNYLVHTSSGTYILTLYEKRVRKQELPFFLDLMEHLARAGLSCPTPVRDRNGQALRNLCGRPAAFITFLEGIWIRRPKAHHCTALGQALAQLHLAGASFGQSRANSLSVNGWRELFNNCHSQADTITPGLSDLIENELSYLEQNWPSDLPAGVIHADLFPDNVFFLNDKVSGLIDFYFACNDMLAYDVAICLNAWCFELDMSLNITKARSMLKGYAQVRTLEEAELSALPLLARGAALRFLLTRVHDWLHTEDGAFVKRKDPNEYIRILRFHQRVSSVREYGLS